MKDIAIIGAGGFGREVKLIIEAINAVALTYNFVGFFDDGVAKETLVNGYPVIGNLQDLNDIEHPLCVVLGIGVPGVKRKIVEKITNTNISYPTIIHPSAIISKDDVTVGRGVVICALSVVTCNIAIQEFVTLNLMCTVGHDTIIKGYSSFMPSVNISGEVSIENGVYVGTGAKIINQLSIGQNTIVGAGAVVSKSLPDNCTAVGIPAKPIKFHDK